MFTDYFLDSKVTSFKEKVDTDDEKTEKERKSSYSTYIKDEVKDKIFNPVPIIENDSQHISSEGLFVL